MIDCDTYDAGCEGGYMYTGYEALEELGGLELESDYPYEAISEKCIFNKAMAKAQIVNSVNITSNEIEIASWLYDNGPISVALNANAMQVNVNYWSVFVSYKTLKFWNQIYICYQFTAEDVVIW